MQCWILVQLNEGVPEASAQAHHDAGRVTCALRRGRHGAGRRDGQAAHGRCNGINAVKVAEAEAARPIPGGCLHAASNHMGGVPAEGVDRQLS